MLAFTEPQSPTEGMEVTRRQDRMCWGKWMVSVGLAALLGDSPRLLQLVPKSR